MKRECILHKLPETLPSNTSTSGEVSLDLSGKNEELMCRTQLSSLFSVISSATGDPAWSIASVPGEHRSHRSCGIAFSIVL